MEALFGHKICPLGICLHYCLAISFRSPSCMYVYTYAYMYFMRLLLYYVFSSLLPMLDFNSKAVLPPAGKCWNRSCSPS